MSLFPSLSNGIKERKDIDQLQQGSLFNSIEYELSGIVNKIKDVNNLDDKEIKNIILRQHQMILNYDLFLMSPETRTQAIILFTNKRFLRNFLDVIRLLELTKHEIICINKLAYDYYIMPENNPEISELLYRLTTEVNGKQVVVLSGILGLQNARILSMIRNSSFKEEKVVHRVNTFIVKSAFDISVQSIVSIYCYLFEKFTNPFIYTMLESRPLDLTPEQDEKFDAISLAILSILDSLPSNDIMKVLYDYGFTLTMIKNNINVRFPIKSVQRYSRIIKIAREIEINSNGSIIIP